MASRPAGRASSATWLRLLPQTLPILGLGVVLALLLAAPGRTVTSKYVNDLFIFLDGAYRIWAGQVPNVDFHSSLGPLTYYLPAAGYGVTGSLAGAMPYGMALVVLALAAIAARVIASRLRPEIGLPLALFLLLIAAVPANPGEGLADLSFAMFYNRIGWAALGLLLVMHLPPSSAERQAPLIDALCAACLILLMLYLKVSYALVGLAFLLLVLLDPLQRRWAGLAIGMVVAAVIAIELVWGGSAAHLADLRSAGRVSGGLPGLRRLTDTVQKNLTDLTVYAFFCLLLLVNARRWRDILFLGLCGGGGVLLIEQNFQTRGIFTLTVGAAVAAEALLRPDARRSRPGGGAARERNPLERGASLLPRGRGVSLPVARGTVLLLLVLLLPVSVQHAASLAVHAGLAVTRAGDDVPLANHAGITLVRTWTSAPEHPKFVRYHETLADGAAALARLERQPCKVFVLDFVGPFTAGLGLQPPRGGSTWQHWGRTVSAAEHLPAAALFADIEVVMEPRQPIEHHTALGLRHLYADYVAAHFELVVETPFWRVYTATAGPVGCSRRTSSATSIARADSSAQP